MTTTLTEAIEDLQYNAWSNAGLERPDKFTQADLAALLDKSDAWHLQMEAQQPHGQPAEKAKQLAARRAYIAANPPASAFEDPGIYFGLVLNRMALDKVLDGWGVPKNGRPVFATMPTGLASASVKHFAQFDRTVYFIDRGTIQLVLWAAYAMGRISKWVGATPQVVSYDYDEALLGFDADSLSETHPTWELGAPISEYVLTGTVLSTPPWTADCPADKYRVYDSVASSAFHFILGHEYGHFAAGHLRASGGDRETLWSQEFEADRYGYQIAGSIEQDLSPGGSTHPLMAVTIGCHIDFFLWALECVEILVAQRRYNQTVRLATPTHPSSTRRRVELNRTVTRSLAVALSNNVPSIMKWLRWIGLKSQQEKLYERAETMYQDRAKAHARFWSHVVFAADKMIDTAIKEGVEISPIWDTLLPLPNSTVACERPWHEEDRF